MANEKSSNPLRAVMDIRKSELPLALLMFTYFFLVITTFWILKPIKKTVFLGFYEGQTFEWLGRLGLPRVFDGRHRFDLRAMPDGGTRVVHSEEFNGVLVRFMRKSLDTQTKQGFEVMNTALKVTTALVVRYERESYVPVGAK